jgi:soluble lytic murein transglycosylase-like protein
MKYLGKAHDLSGGDVCGTLLRYNAGLDAKRKSTASNKFCAKVKSVMAKRS